ncbi:MAG: hypothetical protein QGI63_08790 [Rhodospirillales bacterium]|jgi:hypothetical protein|nr:hypothetical protein [Rhodospirillales bacterium]MDP6774353.1 hypothetical protein [Rhodospirillales bacterium]|tara:strand:+ start:103 stop:372 length:270 start_codon:yes stop_codon:yes gene_type:complete
MADEASEEQGLYLVREVATAEGWYVREFKRVLFTKFEGAWSHRIANSQWRPRGRTLPWSDKTLEEAKRRLLDSLEEPAYYEEPGGSLPK